MLHTGKIADSTINQFEDGYEQLNNIELHDLNEADALKGEDKLKITDLVLKKHLNITIVQRW